MRKIALAAGIAILAQQASAEHWVTTFENFKVDTDSFVTDSKGITRFNQRYFPASGPNEHGIKTHAVDCANHRLYVLVEGDEVGGEVVPDDWGSDDRAAMTLVCSQTKR